jgi:hypothetical protein
MVQSRHRQILRHSAARRFLHSDRSSLAHILWKSRAACAQRITQEWETVLKRLLTALITGIDSAQVED